MQKIVPFSGRKARAVLPVVLILLLVVCLGLLSGYTYILMSRLGAAENEIMQVRNEYSLYQQRTESQMEALEEDVSAAQSDRDKAEAELDELKGSFSELEELYSTLRGDYGSLKAEMEETMDKIDSYEQEVQESMAWFKENSMLGKRGEQDMAKTYLGIDCYMEEGDKCYVKTGCFYLINAEYLGLEYKRDVETSDSEDKLQSLQGFVDNGGGDCEDYSLFYKAEWNYILDKCSGKDIVVQSWYKTATSDSRHWLDFDEDWYIEGVTEKILASGYIYPSVVCGRIYDPQLNKVSGHCVMALTTDRIEDIADLQLLVGSPLIEPQDGQYVGIIDEPGGVHLVQDGEVPLIFSSYIFSVITDNDYFLFSDTESK
ncbi:TPA: hypothetical protein HA265_00705, partial [Candidatus Woesearchaeota archaeon]|nr:hypothetical protein [Candidatus Woesearchaeota archaeon]